MAGTMFREMGFCFVLEGDNNLVWGVQIDYFHWYWVAEIESTAAVLSTNIWSNILCREETLYTL